MTAVPALQASEFEAYFKALTGHDPFPWQRRLLDDLVAGNWSDAKHNTQQWPAAMALPTASGKTACIDIALFHLALQADLPMNQRTAPQRIFFCVDRRVIVDEAYDRSRRIAAKLACTVGQRACDDCRNGAGGSKCAQNGALRSVASRLRQLAGDDDAAPLTVFQLRGGMYRDDAWATSPLQPTVICTTVDQLGSRLLFRGYGVSPRSASIHAGMAANDALILLDEAHCAEPFRQTLDAVRLFRGEKWAEHPLSTPFAFVEMSATSRCDASPFELDDDDRADTRLSRRLDASKPAVLRVSDHSTATQELAQELAMLAVERANAGSRRIAVMVNRVATARLVFAKLTKSSYCDRVLMIGRMRPLDRDDLLRQWQPKLKATPGNEERETHNKPIIVVATQCLEVGANLDFDALITEAASLDALRQRFGRVNRLGRDASCHAVIVAPKDSIKDGADDPIYGPAIAKTWEWLEKHAENTVANAAETVAPTGRKKKKPATAATRTIDFGINAIKASLPTSLDDRAELLKTLSPPAPDAPVMLPAHLDLWCQTTPIPDPDPDVSIFLHGPKRGVPTVSVCWRADLPDDSRDDWHEIVSLIPPSAPECMPGPLWIVRAWLAGRTDTKTDGDVEHAALADEGNADQPAQLSVQRFVLPWRGTRETAQATSEPRDLRPGDVIVIPVQTGGWNALGQIPGLAEPDPGNPDSLRPALAADCAELANLIARRRGVLRLRPDLLRQWFGNQVTPLIELLDNWDFDDPPVEHLDQLKERLQAIGDQSEAGDPKSEPSLSRSLIANKLADLSCSFLLGHLVRHPAGGYVLSLPGRLDVPGLVEEDNNFSDEANESSAAPEPVSLCEHTRRVACLAAHYAEALGLAAPSIRAVSTAAQFHDLGKLDARFQTMLAGSTIRTLAAEPLAKSIAPARPSAAFENGLPQGFRHEMLSMQIAERHPELLDGAAWNLRDLMLHLIASHHGHARPLAPVVIDENPPPLPAFKLKSDGPKADVCVRVQAVGADQRAMWNEIPPHRLDSGVCDRFWTLTRRYGWWGLAYLEAILRLADRAVSREEQQRSNGGNA